MSKDPKIVPGSYKEDPSKMSLEFQLDKNIECPHCGKGVEPEKGTQIQAVVTPRMTITFKLHCTHCGVTFNVEMG